MPECCRCATDVSVGPSVLWVNQKWKWVLNAVDQWQESLKTWVRQPQPIWDGPDWKIEACCVYCQSCWESWAQHVKPGCLYALSTACEEMAIRVGIQWVDPKRHGGHGDPFRCPPCNRFFNPMSLQKHLLEHGDQQHSPQHSPQKRKRETPTPDFTVPTLHVSGCSRCEVVSNVIKGQYTATRWCHGKPVYKKDGIRSVPVLIYFWDNRDGPKFRGWWFGPKEGSQLVWAYNSSNCSQEDLTVPTSGWKVPWDGEVDPTLEITTHDDTDGQKDTDFELRWEFLASADGEKDDWQPASKNINDALERRWKQGWHGDNGTDIFQIQSNGYTYNIDCRCMVQWNVKTNRRREIRRGEAKPDVMFLLPKLAEKDAEVERLQNKRNRLVEEKNDLMAKIAQLEWLGGK